MRLNMKRNEKNEKSKRNKTLLLAGTLLPLVGLLSGCAGMNTHFNCNKVGGIKSCVTLDQVNDLANQGYFKRKEMTETQQNLKGVSKDLSAPVQESHQFAPRMNGAMSPAFPEDGSITATAEAPLRINPSIQNIWISPYVSSNGTYNWPSTITIVVNKGQWIGAPAKAIALSGE